MDESSQIDIPDEIARAFELFASSPVAEPRWVLIAGGVCAGKTRLRREKYTQGFVTLDAAEIFLRLCRGGYYDFPSVFEEAVDLIGYGIARRAVRERRSVVTEIIGAELEPTKRLIEAIKAAGYRCELIGVTSDVQEAWERNIRRSADNISAYYTEPFHRRWILAATEP